MTTLTAQTSALELFIADVIDWQTFVELDAIERAMQGRPPVPELTEAQERRMWWRIVASLEEKARRANDAC